MWRLQFPFKPIALLMLTACAGAFADEASDWQRMQEFQRKTTQQTMAASPPLDPANPIRRPQDLMRIRMENKDLVLRTPIATTNAAGNVKVKLEGSGQWALLRVVSGALAGRPPIPPQSFQFTWNDYSQPHQTTMLSVQTAMQGFLSISKHVQSPASLDTVQLTQQQAPIAMGQPKFVSFMVNRISKPGEIPVTVSLTSPDFFTLLRQHPREVEQYLRPVLRELGQDAVFAPDPLVAWQVLAEAWAPDPAFAAKVNALLPAFNSVDFRERDRAQRELEAMGKDGAVVMVHLDRSLLSPEQNARVDRALAAYAQLPMKEAERLHSDPSFLLDCLYSEDPVIRRAALSRLREVSGKQIAFDVDAAAAARSNAVSALREQLTTPK